MIQASEKKPWPLVGILSGAHKTKHFTGDEAYFNKITTELWQKGGLAFVFTPKGIKTNGIIGYTFCETWQKQVFPYPDIIYNRLPSKKAEARMKPFFNKLNALSIPYFNSFFIDKWEMYELLFSKGALRPFLPETILLSDTEEALQFLQKHLFLYAKPVSGRTGSGIFTLKQNSANEYLLKAHEKTKSLTELQLTSLFSHMLKNKNDYILQQSISLNQHEEKKYDFRILMQKPKKDWMLTGIGARAAEKNGITTHVPRGGSLLSLSDIDPPAHLETLLFLSGEAVSILEETFAMLKECSIDIGRDVGGKYWLFEVNAKPMAFDEAYIEEKRVNTLVETFIHLARKR